MVTLVFVTPLQVSIKRESNVLTQIGGCLQVTCNVAHLFLLASIHPVAIIDFKIAPTEARKAW